MKNVVKNLLNGGQRSAVQNKKTFWDRLCTAIKHNLNADKAVNISKPLLLLNCMQCNVYTSTELICIKNQLQCMDRMLASRQPYRDLSILFLQPLTWINPCVNVSTAQDFVQAVAIKISEMVQFTNIGNIESNK